MLLVYIMIQPVTLLFRYLNRSAFIHAPWITFLQVFLALCAHLFDKIVTSLAVFCVTSVSNVYAIRSLPVACEKST